MSTWVPQPIPAGATKRLGQESCGLGGGGGVRKEGGAKMKRDGWTLYMQPSGSFCSRSRAK